MFVVAIVAIMQAPFGKFPESWESVNELVLQKHKETGVTDLFSGTWFFNNALFHNMQYAFTLIAGVKVALWYFF